MLYYIVDYAEKERRGYFRAAYMPLFFVTVF